jgi:hypothetical protein
MRLVALVFVVIFGLKHYWIVMLVIIGGYPEDRYE